MEGVEKCVGEVREGMKRCVKGVGKYGEVWGMGSRCVEVCLGCGERCGKGVGMVVRGNVGRNVGQSGGARKCGEKGGVTIWDPNSPNPPPVYPDSNFPAPSLDFNSPDPNLPDLYCLDPNSPDSNPLTPTPSTLRFLAATRIFAYFKLRLECIWKKLN